MCLLTRVRDLPPAVHKPVDERALSHAELGAAAHCTVARSATLHTVPLQRVSAARQSPASLRQDVPVVTTKRLFPTRSLISRVAVISSDGGRELSLEAAAMSLRAARWCRSGQD